MCVCVCVCARVCMHVRAHARVRVCVCARRGLQTLMKEDIIQVQNSIFIIECCFYCGL